MMKQALFAAGVLLATASVLFAQATAAINGRVVDQGGAVLPGATVTITESATGVARTTVTNAEGLYSVPALSPGLYNLKVELTGFAAAVNNNVTRLAPTNCAARCLAMAATRIS